jgi:adenine deaminase
VLVLDGIFVVVEQSSSCRDLRGGVQNISTEGAGVCIYVMDDSLPLDCIEMALLHILGAVGFVWDSVCFMAVVVGW